MKRNDFQRDLVHTGLIKKSEIAFERLDKHNDRPKTNAAIAAYNDYLTSCINERNLGLKPIRCFQRVDGLTQKLRDIVPSCSLCNMAASPDAAKSLESERSNVSSAQS